MSEEKPQQWWRIFECRLCRVKFPGVKEIRVSAPSPEGAEHKAAWMAWTYGWERVGDEWQCGIHRGVDPKAKFVIGKCKASPVQR